MKDDIQAFVAVCDSPNRICNRLLAWVTESHKRSRSLDHRHDNPEVTYEKIDEGVWSIRIGFSEKVT